jgi:hypothetical protein
MLSNALRVRRVGSDTLLMLVDSQCLKNLPLPPQARLAIN